MSAFIPVWILGAPFVGLLILSFSFKGPSAMVATTPGYRAALDPGPLDPRPSMTDPMRSPATRRLT
jgi:hypothetical protein